MLYHNPKYKEVFFNGSWESDNLEKILTERNKYKKLAKLYHDKVCDCEKMEDHLNEI